MSLTKHVGLVAGVATLSLTGASFGDTTETNDQDLRARVDQLESALAKYEAKQGDKWMTEARASEIRSLVQDVLNDADSRSSLLQGGGAGWDGGFYLQSSDGNFRLNISGQMQIRWELNWIDDDGSLDGDSTRYGFENSRTKIAFSGHVVNPDWTYRIEGNFQESGGGFGLEDAWINYNYGNGWSVMLGQWKVPLLREELIHSSMQQAVERSLVNSVFTGDRTQGLAFHYADEQWRGWLGFSDGARALNTAAMAFNTEYSLTARAEILFAGNWDQFDDFASWSDEDFGFLLGGALHWQEGEFGTAAMETEILRLTIDGTAEFGGGNLYGAFIYDDRETNGAAGADSNPWGFLVQGGFFLNEDWELFGRYEFGDSDMPGAEDLSILTVGLTNYISGHQLKWTTDVGFAFDEVDAFWGGSPDAGLAAWRTNVPDQEDQVVIRTQLQLLF